MTTTCPVCDRQSETIYRCQHCGRDLVDVDSEDDDQPRTDGGVAVSDRIRSKATVRPHADLLISLPEPPATFIRQDVPDGHRDALQALVHAGAIEQVRRVQVTYDGDISPSYRWRYRTEQWAYRLAVAQVRDRDAPMPCGHAGIRNLGDGEFSCCYDPCQLTYDRSEVALDVQ